MSKNKDKKKDSSKEQKVEDTKAADTKAAAETKAEAKVEAKAPEAKNQPAKKQESPTKKTPVIEAPVVETTEKAGVSMRTVDDTIKILSNGKHGTVAKMSPDSKVLLASLIQKTFIEDPDARVKYVSTVIDEMDNAKVDIIVLSLIDLRAECAERGLNLNTTIAGDRTFLQLDAACKMMGIQLPKPRALANDQLEIDFTAAKVDTNIEEVIATDRKAKAKLEETVPELDPTRITTDEGLKDALNYHMRTSSQNVLTNLFAAVVWLKTYLLFKTNEDAEKTRIESLTIGGWVTELLKYISPTLLLTGIGRKIYTETACDGNPIASHITIRKMVTNDKGELTISEQEIAELVTALLNANAKFVLTTEKPITDNRALKALISGGEDVVEKVVTKESPIFAKDFGMIHANYFNKEKAENLQQMIRNKAGQILNLYLPITERMDTYGPMEEGEFPISTDPKTEDAKDEDAKKN